MTLNQALRLMNAGRGMFGGGQSSAQRGPSLSAARAWQYQPVAMSLLQALQRARRGV